MMRNGSFMLALLLVALSSFGCDGDSSQDNVTKTYGIVAGSNGLLVCTSSNGKTWSQMDVPEALSQADFSGVALSPGEPDKVWVVSKQAEAIMTSTDAGKTWNLYQGELYDCLPSLIQAVDNETAWIPCSCEGNQPLALKTEDGGETWVLQEAGPPVTEKGIVLQGLSVVNSQVVWMSGGYGSGSNSGLVLRTVDGGDTWEAKIEQEGGQLPSDLSYLGVAATSADEAWVVTAHNNTQGSSVYYTTDGGDTWTMQGKDLIGRLYDLNDIKIVGGVIWVAGDNGTVLRSTDGGVSWEIFKTGTSGYNVGVTALNGRTAWAVSTGGGGGSGNIVNTNDSGKTWNKQPYPEKSEFHLLSDIAFEKEY